MMNKFKDPPEYQYIYLVINHANVVHNQTTRQMQDGKKINQNSIYNNELAMRFSNI